MVVAIEIGRMTEGAGAGTVDRRTIAIDPGNLHPADRRMAQFAVAGGVVAMDCGDDVAAMTAGAGRASGNSAVVLDQMVLVIAGVGVVAGSAGRSNTGVDGIPHFRSDPGSVARGARNGRIVGRHIVQGDDLRWSGE